MLRGDGQFEHVMFARTRRTRQLEELLEQARSSNTSTPDRKASRAWSIEAPRTARARPTQALAAKSFGGTRVMFARTRRTNQLEELIKQACSNKMSEPDREASRAGSIEAPQMARARLFELASAKSMVFACRAGSIGGRVCACLSSTSSASPVRESRY